MHKYKNRAFIGKFPFIRVTMLGFIIGISGIALSTSFLGRFLFGIILFLDLALIIFFIYCVCYVMFYEKNDKTEVKSDSNKTNILVNKDGDHSNIEYDITLTCSFTSRALDLPSEYYNLNYDDRDMYLNKYYRERAISEGYSIGVWSCLKSFKCIYESHRSLNRKRFNFTKGMIDPEYNQKDIRIFPGEHHGCKCRINEYIR